MSEFLEVVVPEHYERTFDTRDNLDDWIATVVCEILGHTREIQEGCRMPEFWPMEGASSKAFQLGSGNNWWLHCLPSGNGRPVFRVNARYNQAEGVMDALRRVLIYRIDRAVAGTQACNAPAEECGSPLGVTGVGRE